MKFIFLVLSGMADEPLAALEGQTPLQVAKTPHIDALAAAGVVGRAALTPENMHSGNETATFSLLGYDTQKIRPACGPLDALGRGLALEAEDVAFRCDFVTTNGSKLTDATAGQIGSRESAILVEELNSRLSDDTLRFYAGKRYRHILIAKNSAWTSQNASSECTPPSDAVDKDYKAFLPKGRGRKPLAELMNRAHRILEEHDINKVRVDLNENPANMIWLWSQGKIPAVEPFKDKHGLTGTVVSGTDTVNGIGQVLGLDITHLAGANGFYDTDYLGKAEFAVRSLERHDLALIHVNSADEASLCGDLKQKIQAIENFDSHVVGAVRKYLENKTEWRILITSYYTSSLALKTHTPAPAIFLACGDGFKSSGVERFDESTSAQSKIEFSKGQKLFDFFLKASF